MEVFTCVQCFIGFWKDSQADQKWRFPELPPSQFKKWLELSRPGVDIRHFGIKSQTAETLCQPRSFLGTSLAVGAGKTNKGPKQ